jgi:4'-phosphopantetheinyl transferase EntD
VITRTDDGHLITKVLPAGAHACESFTDIFDEALFPEEEAVIAKAVDKRRREFRTVRACARRALAELGVRRPPLVPGHRGAPSWPAGVRGSMTHCSGYRAAIVAPDSALASVGVDAEPNAPLPDGVLETISLEAERAQVETLERDLPAVSWGRLLFSAKESVYKAWYPLTGRWLGFEEASVTFDHAAGRFEARILADPPRVGGTVMMTFHGSWTVGSGLVLTAVAVPPA